ncbi:RNA polymerase II-associated protein RBA50 [Candida viswanathii]|uniref:RNA polymerase II-associated protein RBA50 n=1 Tax=Candida viswanathii TaxID=5486 RepID=A0A367YGF0_9ASCO|nr:RNA polymerase II-associated protein RBA50 [Candida viswanathii]
MDFVGEIIEHETEVPQEPVPIVTQTGFPEPGKLRERKVSRWKQRQQQKQETTTPRQSKQTEATSETEAEKIHKENLERMSKMTDEEILQEREELLRGLDPKLIQSLINKSKRREEKHNQGDVSAANHHDHDHGHQHAEGYNGWIGSMKTTEGLTDLSQLDKDDVDRALGIQPAGDVLATDRKVKFDNNIKTVNYEDLDDDIELDPNGWEDVDDINELVPNANSVAPEGYQINEDSDEEEANNTVHFTKPKNEDLDINDPDFFDKLHEKYYPDLPKETDKLSWMTQPMPRLTSTTYESISDMRFDFKGDLVELNLEAEEEESVTNDIPTYLGLHHHSDNPHMAGYTLSELAHLSRSTLAAQRCISIQTLGRILHKLGLHKYSIVPASDTDDTKLNQELQQLLTNFENMMWDLVEELRIVETITDAADEKKTSNLSVRNYAIEALWLYKSGGRRPKQKAQNEVEIISEAVQQ